MTRCITHCTHCITHCSRFLTASRAGGRQAREIARNTCCDAAARPRHGLGPASPRSYAVAWIYHEIRRTRTLRHEASLPVFFINTRVCSRVCSRVNTDHPPSPPALSVLPVLLSLSLQWHRGGPICQTLGGNLPAAVCLYSTQHSQLSTTLEQTHALHIPFLPSVDVR